MIRPILYKTFSALALAEVNRLEQSSKQPREAQSAKLMSIISTNAGSSFGAEHGFASIKSVEDYRRAVPIREYEGFRPYVERAVAGDRNVLTGEDPLMYATTSGTAGAPKLIPVTAAYLKEFRLASTASGYHLLRCFPKIDRGTTLSIVSPAEEGRTAGGTPYGAISGALFLSEPQLIRRFIAPIPYEVFLLKDYDSRYYTLLRLSLALPLSCFYTLNPSTIALMSRRLKLHARELVKDVFDGTVTPPSVLPPSCQKALRPFLKPDRVRARFLAALSDEGSFVPHRIWPELQVVSCWTKAAASFYLQDFPEFFGSTPICDISYGASEGRGTVSIGPDKQMLALHSHFFEFIPEQEMAGESPQTLLADQLTSGQKYFILFTTSGGLYRYHINDVVKVVGFHNQTPLLEFQYKGGNVHSFTGEKLSELQVTTAMAAALSEMGLKARFFTLVPQFRPQPHYELWIEPEGNSYFDAPQLGSGSDADPVSEPGLCACLLRLAQTLDKHLSLVNIEYQTKRESQRLEAISIKPLLPGSYERFRKMLSSRGTADAQIKVSHLNPKEETKNYFQDLLQPVGTIGTLH